MDQQTQIATQKIADYLKAIMKEKNMVAQNLIDAGINTQQVYSVLRMGETARPDYKISTFIKVLGQIGIHLEFHDLNNKSNLDLNYPNHKN